MGSEAEKGVSERRVTDLVVVLRVTNEGVTG